MQPTSEGTRVVDGPTVGVIRPPWTEWMLSIVTLGVYAAVRHYRINRELSEFGVEVDPVRALLAFFPGSLVVIPLIVTVHRTTARIRVAQETVGLSPSIDPGTSALLSICVLAHIPREQRSLNEVWRIDGEAQR